LVSALVLALDPCEIARAGVRVEIDGIEGALEANALAMVSLTRAKDDWTAGQVQRLHQRAPAEIQRALQPFGYYQVGVESALEPNGSDWTARYRVTPGPPTIVQLVDVQILGEGASDTTFVRIARDFETLEGAPLDHAAYEGTKNALMRHAAEKGYFAAKFDTSAIVVDVPTARADVRLHLDTGTRYAFGPARLHQDVLDPKRLTGYVGFTEGEPFEYTKLVDTQSALTGVPYFSDVEVKARPDELDGRQVPIDIDLTPAKPQRYEVGAGYGTDTGVRGKVKAEFRRLNRSGHFAEFELQASQIEYSAAAQYKIPWPYPRTELLTLFGGIGHFDPAWSTSTRSLGGATLSHNRGSWRESATLDYEHERFDVADQSGASDLLVLGVGWARTRSNDRIFPTRGTRFEFGLKGAHDAVLSTATFLQSKATAKVVRGLWARQRIIVRGDLAYTIVDDIRHLPPTLRFVTGGDQTVRGYAYESLAPRDAAGRIVGGEALAVGSLEFETRFRPSFGLAAFYDIGNGLSSFDDRLFSGVGAGIRWVSPIGLLRLDGAFGISEAGDPFRVHFAFGPDL
jgi:translocation and assembly module TamA